MTRPVLLIPHYFNYEKYYPTGAALPYEARPEKLRDALLERETGVDVVLSQSERETEDAIVEADYFVGYWIRPELYERAKKLKWIQVASAGMDHFYKLSDLFPEDFRQRGVMLSNAGGVTRIVIAEQVLAYMLMFSRGMDRAMRQQVRREWEIVTADERYGRTVAILGLGGIGERSAELCRCLGMHVVGTKRQVEGYKGAAERVVPADRYRELLPDADYVVLAAPLNEDTRGFINRESLNLMKPTARLINVGRGELIDLPDLISALKEKRIAGAGLDTFGPPPDNRNIKNLEQLDLDSELWELDNVIITPNHASGTARIFDYLAEIIADNCQRLARGEDPKGRYV